MATGGLWSCRRTVSRQWCRPTGEKACDTPQQMTNAPSLIPVFVDHYATGPSGITTYANHLAAVLPALQRIELHAAVPTSATGAIGIPPERSHDPHVVADLLVESVVRHPEARIAWLPNVGHVPWAAAWHALRRLSPLDRERVRLFGIVHGDQESQYDAMRRYSPIIAGLAGVSRQCVATLERLELPGAPSIELLHYPVDVPRETSAPNETAPLRMLYAGRFEESQKQISRLPALFRALADAGVPFEARLAGDGPDGAALMSAIAGLPSDVSACVRLLGAVPRKEMVPLFLGHDLLVLVSAFEGTPLALLEAMAAGVCPVLMALPGGLPELLEDGRNACVVPQGDIAAMASAIAHLHQDRSRLARMKAAARDTLKRRADPVTHGAWLDARLRGLWERRAPDPALVVDPDPLGRRLDDLVAQVLSHSSERVAIWGAGVVGRQIADRMLSAGVTPLLMVDMDPVRRGNYRGIRIDEATALERERPQTVCIGSLAFADDIARTLSRHALDAKVLAP